MTVTVVAEQGSHLLIADGERYAVVERREDHLYNCHDTSACWHSGEGPVRGSPNFGRQRLE